METNIADCDIRLSIYNQFVRLSDKYYKMGNYIIDVKQQDYIPHHKFIKTTSSLIDINYQFSILAYTENINPFNINSPTQMKKIVWKPYSKIPNCEFEELFGFGSKNYDENKQIMIFPKYKLYSLQVVKFAMLNTIYDETYIQQVKDLMLYGGYINDKAALDELV